jgi:hypothetical protein
MRRTAESSRPIAFYTGGRSWEVVSDPSQPNKLGQIAVSARARFKGLSQSLHNSGLPAQPLACKLLILKTRRDVRVVEGARLESVCRGNSTVGSNPTLSAKFSRSSSITYKPLCSSRCNAVFCRFRAQIASATGEMATAGAAADHRTAIERWLGYGLS